MQFRNKLDKERIAYLCSLTLLFSYAETLLPKIIPFLRLGLGNVVILQAFDLNFPAFFILSLIKAVSSCVMSGTLFSPFFILSLVQSVVSAGVMYSAVKVLKGKGLSIYGISLLGSAASAVIQILLTGIYLGKGTYELLGIMLLFSVLSGIVTAFLSTVFVIPENTPGFKENTPQLKESENGPENSAATGDKSERENSAATGRKIQEKAGGKKIGLLYAVLILLAVVFIFWIKNIYVLLGLMFGAFILQFVSGRKIRLLPHIFMWIFVIITSLLVPYGKVLLKFWNLSITEGAFISGLTKSLRLSAVMALSQCAAAIKIQGNGILALSLKYFRTLIKTFDGTSGKLLERMKETLGKNKSSL